MAGTRKLVLYLAEHKQAPSIPKSRKNGWEAADRFFFGFLDTARYLPSPHNRHLSSAFNPYPAQLWDPIVGGQKVL